MITKNLSTLKIYKLTQEQYDRDFDNGSIDEDAIYITPNEKIDLSPYVTAEQLATKADVDHTHATATTSTSGLMSATDKTKLDGIETGANKTIVDSSLSSTSTNPLQNKVVNTAISNLNMLVGDTAVSTQISNAVAQKSSVQIITWGDSD